MAQSEEGYVHVGDVLRDALVGGHRRDRLEPRRASASGQSQSALQRAAPHRGGYLLDTSGWAAGDFNFLRMEVDAVYEKQGHSFMSRGFPFGSSRIGRQIRALREKL